MQQSSIRKRSFNSQHRINDDQPQLYEAAEYQSAPPVTEQGQIIQKKKPDVETIKIEGES